LKKRSKKLSSIWGAGVFTGKYPDDQSFFASFFPQKRRLFLPSKTTEPVIGSAS